MPRAKVVRDTPVCKVCNKPIFGQQSNSKVHRECKNQWDYIRKKEQSEQLASAWKKPRPCEYCTDTFMPIMPHQTACSKPECKAAQKHDAEVRRKAGKARGYSRYNLYPLESYAMSCPWVNGYMTTLPQGMTTWDCAEMDPMSAGTAMVMLNMETESVRKAA